jgi:hypothetical protein
LGREKPKISLAELDRMIAERAAADDERLGRGRLDQAEARIHRAAAARQAESVSLASAECSAR